MAAVLRVLSLGPYYCLDNPFFVIDPMTVVPGDPTALNVPSDNSSKIASTAPTRRPSRKRSNKRKYIEH
jgi:hypothetical protein